MTSETSDSKPGTISHVIVALTALIAIWGCYRCWQVDDRLVLDETQAYGQVRIFLDGKWELYRYPGFDYPAAATLPGFPLALTIVAAVTHQSSAPMLRMYCFGFSVMYAVVVYCLAKRLTPQRDAAIRAAQTLLLPIVFPFNCLLYTDVLSLLVCGAALLAALRRSFVLAGGLMLIAMFIRQTNVVFIAFILGFTYLEANGWQLSRDRVYRFARETWPLLFGFVAFAVFVLVNGRVALDAPSQQPLAFSPGNPAFFLVVIAMVFLPALLAHLLDIFRWTRAHWIVALVIACIAVYVAFTYIPPHPWNDLAILLRNHVLYFLLHSRPRRGIFAGVLIIVAIWIAARGFSRTSGWMLLPFWFCSLAPIALVEPRYEFPAIVLFQLLRKPENRAIETILWLWFAVACMILMHVITTTYYIP